MSNKYGLLGKVLTHSYSQIIHHLLGNTEYSCYALDEVMLDKFLKERNFLGYNVTIPYKKTVMPYCDIISQCAKKIGSVNTLINKNGILYGDNTDYFGFSYMAQKAQIKFQDKKVLVLGSGGTSVTAVAVAKDQCAKSIVVVSRNGEINYSSLDKFYDFDIIINTTPVGMYPKNGEKVIDLDKFKNCTGVIDVIYNPLYTELLFDAKAKGINYTNGLSMLVAQAVKAHELFFNTNLDDDIIDKITTKIENDVKNIVLIGMPGSGKTTIGELLAKNTGRKLIDTDNLVELSCGKSIPEIFKTQGEFVFRELETQAIFEAGKGQGAVISTGGGCVKKVENYKALKQNGQIFYLKRDLDNLATNDRPLSKDKESLCKLYYERKELYEKYADEIINCDDGINETLQKILEKI